MKTFPSNHFNCPIFPLKTPEINTRNKMGASGLHNTCCTPMDTTIWPFAAIS